MIDESYGNCQIGLEAIPNEISEYRLGTIFLRNFYTALDYENDLIILGVNTGMESVARAKVRGHIYNPFKPRFTAFKIMLVFIFIAIVAASIAFYVHRKVQVEAESKKVAPKQDEVKQEERPNYLIQDEDDPVEDLSTSLVNQTPGPLEAADEDK